MKSWRSTVFASGGLGYVLFDTVAKLLDEDPTTNPDWMLLGGVIFAVAATYLKQSPLPPP